MAAPLVFLVAILSSATISGSVTCNGELRSRHVCYYALYCESVDLPDSINEADLNVTCSGHSALVSWSATKASIINLYYHCFLTENNTQISTFPVYFEESSDFTIGMRNLYVNALMNGTYCIFGGCYQNLATSFSRQFPNTTCGFVTNHSSSMKTTSLPHVSISTVSVRVLPSVSRMFAHSPTLQSITTASFVTDQLSSVHSSSMKTTSLPHVSSFTVSVLPSVSRKFAALSPTLMSTNIPFAATGLLEELVLVVSIVLISVAVVLITIALGLFCYTFYYWKKISQAHTTADKESRSSQLLTDIKL